MFSLTLVSSVGRAWDCSEKNVDIPGSPVQSRNEGIKNFIFISRQICTTGQYDPNQDGDGTQGAFQIFGF